MLLFTADRANGDEGRGDNARDVRVKVGGDQTGWLPKNEE